MREYYTEALVISARESGEMDKIVTLLTESLGKVRVKARSSRKPTSKMAGHLDPLTFLSCRIIEKYGFQIADPLSSHKIAVSKGSLDFLRFLDEMIPELDPDNALWEEVKNTAELFPEKQPDYRIFLKVLGFDPEFSRCHSCENAETSFFSKNGHFFLCSICAANIMMSHPFESERDLWEINQRPIANQ